MPECAKTHLQQSGISKFSGEDSRTPSSRGGEGRGREGREGGKEKGRIGKGGEGRELTEEGRRGGMGGTGGALDMGSPQRQALDPPMI